MKFRLRKLYRGGQISLFGGIIVTVGNIVIKDLKKEDSLIKHAIKKIPYIKKRLIKKENNNQEDDSYRVVENSIKIN